MYVGLEYDCNDRALEYYRQETSSSSVDRTPPEQIPFLHCMGVLSRIKPQCFGRRDGYARSEG